ncbi:459_t:CDS:2, partial [Gigaspora margarita]
DLVILWKTKAENTFKIVPSMQKIVPTINNFEDKIIEFSNVTNDIIEVNLVKIKRDLIEWKSNHNEIRDQMKRLEHFVDIKRFYIDLWNLAKQSLGDPSPKKLRGWVSLYIRSYSDRQNFYKEITNDKNDYKPFLTK